MASLIRRRAVCLSVWVDYAGLAPSSTAFPSIRTVGSGRCAAVGVVAKLVDVHATLGVAVMAGKVP